ncbi:MAG: helix-turn-helix transcriptional regulator [Lawsonibacter sp.]|nr:helix-turn-helix transcriptional regulator [Lawsonibacter sp.]
MEYYAMYLRGLREDHGLSQENIAKILDTSQTMYARYERGANELPIRHLITLCKFYKVSSDEVLGLDEKKRRYPQL